MPWQKAGTILCKVRQRIPDYSGVTVGRLHCLIFFNLMTLFNKVRGLLVYTWHWNIYLNIPFFCTKNFRVKILQLQLSASLIAKSAVLYQRTWEKLLPVCLIYASAGWSCWPPETSASVSHDALPLWSRALDCICSMKNGSSEGKKKKIQHNYLINLINSRDQWRKKNQNHLPYFLNLACSVCLRK